jgi:hypothetical protein
MGGQLVKPSAANNDQISKWLIYNTVSMQLTINWPEFDILEAIYKNSVNKPNHQY